MAGNGWVDYLCHATYPLISAGLAESEINAATQAAKARNIEGYVLALQNTTQQPAIAELTNRATRKTIFNNSWPRTERGGDTDTRDTIGRLAQLRAEKAKLLSFPTYAASKLQDQMAKTPEAVETFLGELIPAATNKAKSERTDTDRPWIEPDSIPLSIPWPSQDVLRVHLSDLKDVLHVHRTSIATQVDHTKR